MRTCRSSPGLIAINRREFAVARQRLELARSRRPECDTGYFLQSVLAEMRDWERSVRVAAETGACFDGANALERQLTAVRDARSARRGASARRPDSSSRSRQTAHAGDGVVQRRGRQLQSRAQGRSGQFARGWSTMSSSANGARADRTSESAIEQANRAVADSTSSLQPERSESRHVHAQEQSYAKAHGTSHRARAQHRHQH